MTWLEKLDFIIENLAIIEDKAVKDYFISLSNWALDNKGISITDDEILDFISHWYNMVKKGAVSSEVDDKAKKLARQLAIDVNTYLDFIGQETYKYKDTTTLPDDRVVNWSIDLGRESYTFKFLDRVVNKPYLSMSVDEVKGIYNRLRVAIVYELRFINLDLIVKDF